jgi:CRP-like cAMP-binding protein
MLNAKPQFRQNSTAIFSKSELAARQHCDWPTSTGAVAVYHRGQTVPSHKYDAPAFWRLGTGAIVMSAPKPDGTARILEFVLPGDFFCCPEADDAFKLEAAVDGTCVTMYQASAAEALAAILPLFRPALDAINLAPAHRFWRQILILGSEVLEERLGAFLTDMYDRLSSDCDVPVALPMFAEHVAEYLSVTKPELLKALRSFALRSIIRLNRRGTITILKRPNSSKFPGKDNEFKSNRQSCQKVKAK